MPAAIDLIGQRFGRLVALEPARTAKGVRGWLCQCDCGQQIIVVTDALGTGNTASCGCTRKGFIDRTGHRYGNLTVLYEDTSQKFKQAQWVCLCVCGIQVSRRGGDLTYGRSAQDCGCIWRPHKGDARRLPSGVSALRALLRRFKYDAQKRGYSWALTDAQTKLLIQQPCFYCGELPTQVSAHPQQNGTYTYTGLDRKDNTRGYELDNVVACCKYCNYAKGERTIEIFLAWVARIQRRANSIRHSS
jgi:hypothetical protein